jgi:hypothetical protein
MSPILYLLRSDINACWIIRRVWNPDKNIVAVGFHLKFNAASSLRINRSFASIARPFKSILNLQQNSYRLCLSSVLTPGLSATCDTWRLSNRCRRDFQNYRRQNIRSDYISNKRARQWTRTNVYIVMVVPWARNKAMVTC